MNSTLTWEIRYLPQQPLHHYHSLIVLLIVSWTLWLLYLSRESQKRVKSECCIACSNSQKAKVDTNVTPTLKPRKRTKLRSSQKYKLQVRNKDGTLQAFQSTDTLWYMMYLQNPPRNNRLCKFRVTHNSFLDLVCDLKTMNYLYSG